MIRGDNPDIESYRKLHRSRYLLLHIATKFGCTSFSAPSQIATDLAIDLPCSGMAAMRMNCLPLTVPRIYPAGLLLVHCAPLCSIKRHHTSNFNSEDACNKHGLRLPPTLTLHNRTSDLFLGSAVPEMRTHASTSSPRCSTITRYCCRDTYL